jgi:hypothetical protein
VKQVASGVGVQAVALFFGALVAACVLEPSSAGPARIAIEVVVADESTPSDAVAEGTIVLPKDISRIEALSHLTSLSVPGFPDAVVSVPWDASGPRPVVLVLHGLGDRPETHCEAWRTITHAAAFVLCLRGEEDAERSAPGRRRYTLGGGVALKTHVESALSALSARFGDRVDLARPLLAGFSLGATQAALLAQNAPETFPRVAVVEGGLDVWIGPTIGPFVAGGGRRVLFGCGSSWCTPPARAAAGRIGDGGARSRVAFADVGHHDVPELQRVLMADLAWFVEGDARWTPLVSEPASAD